MKSRHENPQGQGATSGMVKDPVCGMDVDPKKAVSSRTGEGQEQYFCSTDCRDKFATQQGSSRSGSRQQQNA